MFTRNSTLEVCVHWVPILREITILISKEAVQNFTPTSSGRVFLLIHILPQHRPSWTFLILVFLTFVRWYPSIILICIPLMIMDASNDTLLSFCATGKVLFLPQLNVPGFLDSQWKVFYFLRRRLGVSWGRWPEGEGVRNYGWYVKQ